MKINISLWSTMRQTGTYDKEGVWTCCDLHENSTELFPLTPGPQAAYDLCLAVTALGPALTVGVKLISKRQSAVVSCASVLLRSNLSTFR